MSENYSTWDDERLEEESAERCPICNTVNFRGSGSECEHLVAYEWDGQIMLSDNSEAFESAWGELRGILEEAGDEMEDLAAIARRIATQRGLDPTMVDRAYPDDPRPLEAITELADLKYGPTVATTHSMLSGSGGSLYHKDPDVFLIWARRYRELVYALNNELGSAADQ